jgi:periplasmic protein CpxP/Spy
MGIHFLIIKSVIMKKVLFSMFLMGASLSAFAQKTPNASTPVAIPVTTATSGDKADAKHKWGSGEQAERLKAALGLSEEQAAKVKQIQQDFRAAQKELKENTGMARKDKKAKRDALVAERDTKMKAVLSPDQFAKYTEMVAKMKERMKERGGENRGNRKAEGAGDSED